MEILIADDSKMVRYMTIEVLNALGYTQITEANNVSEAKTLMLAKKFDLIFSDFHMPGETGLDFLRYVRATPQYAKIPFILMTTDNEQKNIVAAVQSGVQAYIIKPVQKLILTQKLTDISKKFNFQAPNTSLGGNSNTGVISEGYSARGLSSFVTALEAKPAGFSFEVTNYGARSVEVFTGKGIGGAFSANVQAKYPGARTVLLCDQIAFDDRKEEITTWAGSLTALQIVIADISKEKTMGKCAEIIDKLAKEGVDSSAVLVAVGDSDLLDIAGFVAASYLGGITFIAVPTSLHALLNGSVGSMRTVHGAQSKNTATIPCEPSVVWFELDHALDMVGDGFTYACMELFRYAFIGGTEVVEATLKLWDKITQKEEAALVDLLRMCFAVRVSILSMNVGNASIRAIIEFAQPIAKAIDIVHSSPTLIPGQALAKAILCLFDASSKADVLSRADMGSFVDLVKKIPLFKIAPAMDVNAVYEAAFKANPLTQSASKLALICTPGSVSLQSTIPEQVLRNSLTTVLNPAPQ